MTKIHYIVTTFLGDRRIKTVADPVEYTRQHLTYLQDNQIDISKVTIVVNCDDLADYRAVKSVIKYFEPYYTELSILAHKNVDYSYGGWNFAIENDIQEGIDYDYYILFEDDYRPDHPDFISILTSCIDLNTVDVIQYPNPFTSLYNAVKIGYVCGMVSNRVSPHAAISYGMLSGKAAREAHEKFGSALLLIGARYNYGMAEMNQMKFLDNIKSLGYTLTDIRGVCSVPFLDSNPEIMMREFGTPGMPRIIVPVYEFDALHANLDKTVAVDTFTNMIRMIE
jgi:hypothetical protein